MTRYFIDADGKYIGAFVGSEPPAGAIEIDAPPAHGLDTWDFQAESWIPYEEPASPEYPDMVVMQDIVTGQPVKVSIKNGEVLFGGLNDEAPA